MSEFQEIVIKRPIDFHGHLREGDLLSKVVGHSNLYDKVVAMGNLSSPVISGRQAQAYQKEIIESGAKFEPIMSIMMTRDITTASLYDAYAHGVRVLKLIPGGTSTGSGQGISLKDLIKYYDVLKFAEELGMIFSGHWELISEYGRDIPEIQRECRAIPHLLDVIRNFQKLKIIVEHISTEAMVDLVIRTPKNVAATVTGHHLGPFSQRDVFCSKDGVVRNSALYCKPPLKSLMDVYCVKQAALNGGSKVFFGSDSAPHWPHTKEFPRPNAGIFAPAEVVLPWIWSVFESDGKKPKDFERFTSIAGAEFYGIPVSEESLTMTRGEWQVPGSYDGFVPFLAGRKLDWKIVG